MTNIAHVHKVTKITFRVIPSALLSILYPFFLFFVMKLYKQNIYSQIEVFQGKQYVHTHAITSSWNTCHTQRNSSIYLTKRQKSGVYVNNLEYSFLYCLGVSKLFELSFSLTHTFYLSLFSKNTPETLLFISNTLIEPQQVCVSITTCLHVLFS